MTISFAVFVGLSALFAVKASAATYYVAGDVGDDTRTSVQAQVTTTPWKTIQKAADTMVAGDTVNVKGGITYTKSSSSTAVVSVTTSGSSGNQITYQAWPETGTPIIDASTNSNAFQSNASGYITISGFIMKGWSIAAISFGMGGGGTNIRVQNCVFYGSRAHTFDTGVGIVMGTNYVYNNTFYGINYGISDFGMSMSTIESRNNIFMNIITTAEIGTGISSDYNLFYNNGLDHSGHSAGAHDIAGQNPNFTNPTDGNFSQTSTSPTINAGISVAGITIDIAGNPRPGGGTQDIGAYEYKQFYVAGDTGNNTSGKGTTSAPWATIQKAANVLIAGDTVNVKGGVTYSTGGVSLCTNLAGEGAVVCINGNSGTSGNYITYRAWAGTGTPIIDTANSPTMSVGIGVVKNYIKVDGFEVRSGTAGSNPADIIINDASDSLTNDVIIQNNILKHTGGVGGIWAVSLTNLSIYHNTIYGSGTARGMRVGISTNFNINNNIIVNSTDAIRIGSSSSYSINYNLLYNNTTNCNSCTLGAHDITGQDPLFVNAAGGNYTLNPSSPAIGAGTTLSSVATDIIGVARPQGSGYDIGAYEHYSQAVTVNAVTPDPGNDNTPTVTGTVSTISGATITSVEYMVDSGSWTSSGVSAVDGTFDEQSEDYTVTIPSALTDGSHTIYVRIGSDSYGTRSSSVSDTFVIDTSTPPEPVITDLGKIDEVPNKDNLYYYFTSPTATIKGKAEANSTIYFKNGEDIYTGSTDTKGIFTVKLTNLPSGLVELIYYTVDRAGNKSTERELFLVIGIENFPDWLLTELGINSDTVTPGTEVNEEDLDTQNDNQEDVQHDMEENNGLPVTNNDAKTENAKDSERANSQAKKVLLYCLPIILIIILAVAGITYFTGKHPNNTTQSQVPNP